MQQQQEQRQARPQYVAPNETITRPILAELKKRIDTNMDKTEIEKLLGENEEWLRIMVS